MSLFIRTLAVSILVLMSYSCQSQESVDRKIMLKVTGNVVSNVALFPLTGNNTQRPIKAVEQAKPGDVIEFVIDKGSIPSDFQLFFEFRNPSNGQPARTERRVFINKQNVEVQVNPMYASVDDSVHFAVNDMENNQFLSFMAQNNHTREMLGVLQMVLSKYDSPDSKFYKEALKEYTSKHKEHTEWIKKQTKEHSKLLISHTFRFQYIPQINWTLDEEMRKQSMLDDYMALADFNDIQVLQLSDYRKWLDSYVNLHFGKGYNAQQVDSALTTAGKRMIEMAKSGDPKLYGHMVDYFFEGFESMDLQGGIRMLNPYVNDPKCLATKKTMIQRRLQGLNTLYVGAVVPDFEIVDSNEQPLKFSKFSSNKPYKMLMFWSADCEYCKQFTDQLYPFYTNSKANESFDVLALSLDDTETEIPMWQKSVSDLPAWTHARAKGGLLSAEAQAYFVVATPVILIVDSKTNKIVSIPQTARDVALFFKE
ncbi:MAG: thioredoxin-like domain-containing protein [Salinivirgaceae bacterium]|nr:thioredoxin-like domain-containing protein [Salinivirgaceae bacterium]